MTTEQEPLTENIKNQNAESGNYRKKIPLFAPEEKEVDKLEFLKAVALENAMALQYILNDEIGELRDRETGKPLQKLTATKSETLRNLAQASALCLSL